MTFYKNCEETGNKIVNAIMSQQVRWIGVMGQTQGGKTSAIQAAAQIYLDQLRNIAGDNHPNLKFLFLTGLNDKDYKAQFEDDYKRNKCTFPYELFKNHDLTKNRAKLEDIQNDRSNETVVFIDESSYGMEKGSSIDQLLKDIFQLDFSVHRQDINKQLKDKHLRIITVSATPVPEMIRHKYGILPIPYVVLHHPDYTTYHSMQDMLNDKCVWDNASEKRNDLTPKVYDADHNFTDKFKYAMARAREFAINENEGQHWIIRSIEAISDPHYFEHKLKEEFGETWHFDIRTLASFGDVRSHILQSKKSIFDEQLFNPRQIKVTIINDMLRLAIRVPMHRVGFIWDSVSSNFDVAVQSLAGRRCGYGSKNRKIPVFTSRDCIEAYAELWSQLTKYEDDQFAINRIFSDFIDKNATTKSRPESTKETHASIVTIIDFSAHVKKDTLLDALNKPTWQGRNNKDASLARTVVLEMTGQIQWWLDKPTISRALKNSAVEKQLERHNEHMATKVIDLDQPTLNLLRDAGYTTNDSTKLSDLAGITSEDNPIRMFLQPDHTIAILIQRIDRTHALVRNYLNQDKVVARSTALALTKK